MKRLSMIVLVALFLIVALSEVACRQGQDPNDLAGRWEGTIAERGEPVRVGLELRREGSALTGTFTVLDGLPDGADVKADKPYRLANVKESGRAVEFVVLLMGEVEDPDNPVFELSLEDGQLTGTMREQRADGKETEVTFSRAG